MKVRPSVKPICDKCKVIKRKGKKVDFDGAKIAVAIKKGFKLKSKNY